MLELIYSKEMFYEILIDHNYNLNRYLTDIAYDDINGYGWMSINYEKYKLNVTRICEDEFKFDFNMKLIDLEKDISITTSLKI